MSKVKFAGLCLIFFVLCRAMPVVGKGTDGWRLNALDDIMGMTLMVTRTDGRLDKINPKIAWTSNRGSHLSQLQFGITCDPFESRPMVMVDEMAYLFESDPSVKIDIDGTIYHAKGRPNPNPRFANFGFITSLDLIEDLQSGQIVKITFNDAHPQTHSLKGSRDVLDQLLDSCS